MVAQFNRSLSSALISLQVQIQEAFSYLPTMVRLGQLSTQEYTTLTSTLSRQAAQIISQEPRMVYFSRRRTVRVGQKLLNGPTNEVVTCLIISGINLFAGTFGRGVYSSSDNGAAWTAGDTGLSNTSVYTLAASGTNLFVGTYGGGVFCSTNNASNWTSVNSGLTNTTVYALATGGVNLFAGTAGGGVFLSTNNGSNWIPVNSGLTNMTVTAFEFSDTNVFAGTYGGGVFVSKNNATEWAAVNAGLTDYYLRALLVNSTNLLAGTKGGFVWRRPLSDMTTSVNASPSEVPVAFRLAQNYPNPLNPSATISFSLPSKSFISLKVFDALGREVASLISEELPAGTYSKRWSALGMPSDAYFYRLQAGSFIETKKLVLLR